MDLLTYVGIFVFGSLFGIVLISLIIKARQKYNGIIQITSDKEEKRVVYTLELFEDPSNLIFAKEVRFKVDTSEE